RRTRRRRDARARQQFRARAALRRSRTAGLRPRDRTCRRGRVARVDHEGLTERFRENDLGSPGSTSKRMSDRLDIRDIPTPKRHPKVHESFGNLKSGEALTLVNDHDPKPLFYEMQAEISDFDAEGYEVEERGENEFVATLPTK